MFHISYIVDDKYLAQALRSVAGIAHELSVLPVINAEKKSNKVTAHTNGAGDELLLAELLKRKMTEFTGSQAKAIVGELGKPPASYSHYVSTLKQQGYVKDHGRIKGTNANKYTVTAKANDK